MTELLPPDEIMAVEDSLATYILGAMVNRGFLHAEAVDAIGTLVVNHLKHTEQNFWDLSDSVEAPLGAIDAGLIHRATKVALSRLNEIG